MMIDFHNRFSFDTIASTHKAIQETKFPFGSWVLAEKQSKGIGQNHKTWEEFGTNHIYFSAKVLISNLFFPLQLFPILTASATLKSLHVFFPREEIFWKWTNDLYKKQRKIAGILIESSLYQEQTSLIISIGINLEGKQERVSQELQHKVGFLAEKLQNFDKELFLKCLIDSLNLLFKIPNQNVLDSYFQHLERHNYLRNKELSFTQNGEKVTAFLDKIDFQTGKLLLKDKNKLSYSFFESPEDFTIYH